MGMTGKNVAETGTISPERAEMGLLSLVGNKTFSSVYCQRC
jgi:hypothetical protein